MHRSEAVYAIPLWVNGRAILRLASAFHEVRNPVTEAIVRRVPLCGRDDFEEAFRSAGGSLAAWSALGEAGRRERLADLGEALSGFSGHFASLMAEETGKAVAQAEGDIARAVSLLRRPAACPAAGVAVVSGAGRTLPELVEQVGSALAGGSALVVFPALASPSIVFALAELSGQCGFPPGTINVLYAGDDAVAGWSSDAGSTAR